MAAVPWCSGSHNAAHHSHSANIAVPDNSQPSELGASSAASCPGRSSRRQRIVSVIGGWCDGCNDSGVATCARADTGVIDVEVVRQAFLGVTSPGRLEAVRSAPTILLDAAHNPHGMAATVAALEESFSFRRLIGVIAVLGDKDVRGMLAALDPVLDEIVVTENSSHRRLPVDDLAALAVDVFGAERVAVEPRLDDAIETAVDLADEGDGGIAGAGVLITGSVITAGEARTLLAGARPPT